MIGAQEGFLLPPERRAESREHGAREQGAGSKEQGEGSGEQGARSREKGVGSRVWGGFLLPPSRGEAARCTRTRRRRHAGQSSLRGCRAGGGFRHSTTLEKAREGERRRAKASEGERRRAKASEGERRRRNAADSGRLRTRRRMASTPHHTSARGGVVERVSICDRWREKSEEST